MPNDFKKENNIIMQSKKNSYKEKKKWKWFIAGMVLIIFCGMIVWIFINTPRSSQDMGLSGYTQEELDKMYPKIKNADVPTRTTPEQTYARLKEALRNEDVEAAAECFDEEVREEYRSAFIEAKSKRNMSGMAEKFPDELKKDNMYEAIAFYNIPQEIDGKVFEHSISFVKDNNGDWKIKSL